jgi:hypothetical protein
MGRASICYMPAPDTKRRKKQNPATERKPLKLRRAVVVEELYKSGGLHYHLYMESKKRTRDFGEVFDMLSAELGQPLQARSNETTAGAAGLLKYLMVG